MDDIQVSIPSKKQIIRQILLGNSCIYRLRIEAFGLRYCSTVLLAFCQRQSISVPQQGGVVRCPVAPSSGNIPLWGDRIE